MTACKLCFELFLDFFDRSLPWGGEKDNQPEVCVRCQNSIKKPKKDFIKWKKKDEGQSVILSVKWEGREQHRAWKSSLSAGCTSSVKSAVVMWHDDNPCYYNSVSRNTTLFNTVKLMWSRQGEKEIWKHKSKETHFVLKRSLFTPFLLQLC